MDVPVDVDIDTVVAAEPPAATAALPSHAPSDNRPWVEKYRPQSLDQVVAHEQILGTITRLMHSHKLPHLLFYGPPGTGKTSTAQALCRAMFGQAVKGNVLELNASDDRGIDVVRNEIKQFASTGRVMFGIAASAMGASPSAASSASGPGPIGGVKVVILDEADQMSSEAQAALRRIVEKYTRNVRFMILCNHVNKIIPALQSRCSRFRFGPVKKSQIMARLAHVATSESVPFTPEGLSAAFHLSSGDMRRCINIMHAAALSLGEITASSVYVTTGNPTPAEVDFIVQAMVSDDFSEAWRKVNMTMSGSGLSVVDLVRELHAVLREQRRVGSYL